MRESRRARDLALPEQGALPYEALLQECLGGEFRVANRGLPQTRKSLATLLTEDRPHVVCTDGGTQSFKAHELQYLAGLLDPAGQQALSLPIMIELVGEGFAAAALCSGEAEEKVLGAVLGMPVKCDRGRIRLYRPQLALVRKRLRTTTQYVFSQRSLLR